MINEIIAFLVMLNPFALFIYLQPIMKELESKDFKNVLFKASIISFLVFVAFLVVGDFIIKDLFQINIDSFRIFGGIIIFSMAYLYIVRGERALIVMKEDLDDLASEIALPFMVGSGTISLTILMNQNLSYTKGIIALFIILVLNYFIILSLKCFRDQISKSKFRVAFDKNMIILMRIVGFFIGAIGINMILSGIKNLFSI